MFTCYLAFLAVSTALVLSVEFYCYLQYQKDKETGAVTENVTGRCPAS